MKSKTKVTDSIPSRPTSVSISSADNGFVVECYKNDKQIKTVHESLEGAMASVKKMMGNIKIDKKSDMSPELKGYMKED